MSRTERVADWAERWAKIFGTSPDAAGAQAVITELVAELRKATKRGPVGNLLHAVSVRLGRVDNSEVRAALAELEQALSRLRLEGDIDARVRDVLDGVPQRGLNATHSERDVRRVRDFLHTHVAWPLGRAVARLKGE